MKHIWSIACLRSITDKDTNLMSLIDFVEGFKVPKKVIKHSKKNNVPIRVPVSFEIINYLITDNDNNEEVFELQIDLINPEKKIIKENTLVQKLRIKKPHNKIRARLIVNGITTQTEGRYYYIVKLKDKDNKAFIEVAQIPIDVKFEE